MDWNRVRYIAICFFIGLFSLSYHAYSQNANAIDSLIEMGDDMVDMEDYKAAEDKYDQALDINENYVLALKAKIRVLLLREKYNRARRLAENSLETHKDQPAFYLYLGEASIGRERYEEAMDHLNDALEIVDDTDSKLLNRIYVNLGAAYQKQNNFEEALNHYSKALDIDQTNPNVFLYRGNLYYKREAYEDALADFKKVLELDPNNHLAQYNLGMCYFRQGDKLNACDAFHNACEMGNKNACRMVVSKCLRESQSQ
ncbi:MAG: tetratricopeptide repeat protein [Bacteroidales bacterium]|nr:tetratricopeptide repeat protein [Bacteroidales bacterium]MBS3774464.1 tetratricopeptide repeat protein [Bacteroidales bacterium]